MNSPVFVAIDTPLLKNAEMLARAVKSHVGGIKLGLEFFLANGPAGVETMASLDLPIFLDLKLHDIPNTVAKAVTAIAPLGASILTVHAAGGQTMLAAAREAAPTHMKIVAVTMLTSMDTADLAATGISSKPLVHVKRLARLAQDAGVDGIVCSGAEVATVRASWADGVLIVPGVRPAEADRGDQKRIVTPRAAIDAGASIIVIGRPITGAADPAVAAEHIAQSLH